MTKKRLVDELNETLNNLSETYTVDEYGDGRSNTNMSSFSIMFHFLGQSTFQCSAKLSSGSIVHKISDEALSKKLNEDSAAEKKIRKAIATDVSKLLEKLEKDTEAIIKKHIK